jgi:hypothetical protein
MVAVVWPLGLRLSRAGKRCPQGMKKSFATSDPNSAAKIATHH